MYFDPVSLPWCCDTLPAWLCRNVAKGEGANWGILKRGEGEGGGTNLGYFKKRRDAAESRVRGSTGRQCLKISLVIKGGRD